MVDIDLKTFRNIEDLLSEAVRAVRRSPQAKLVWGEDHLRKERSLFIEAGPGRPVVQLTITTTALQVAAVTVLNNNEDRVRLIDFIQQKAAESPPPIKGRYGALMED